MVVNSLLLASFLLTLQTYVAVNAIPKQNLHHHMTKREIEQYFGVDDHNKVPEYDITHPYQSNEQGDFVSHSMHTRNRRDTGPQKPSFYKMDAFGTKLHLKLKRNDHLMAPGMMVLREQSDGTTTQHPVPENTFYLGHVTSDPRSIVAVSSDGGLAGMVKTSRDTLFVHPLPTHLAKHVTGKKDALPHIVYRRSTKGNWGSCETLEDEGEDENEDGYQQTTRLRRSLENKIVSNTMNDDSAPSISKVLEAALLYPPTLADKYNKGNLNESIGGVEKYLLLLGNMVAGMYQDPTIGKRKILYKLTQIKMIQPSEYGLNAGTTKGRIVNLIRNKVNSQKVSYDVFSYVSNQFTGGAIANLAEVCKRTTGNANEDIGLQTAIHIAHEIAHNLGINHDYGDCDNLYIMHETLPGGEHATEWSECSRNAIQTFLADKKRSHCLKDGSGDDTMLSVSLRETLPGLILDGDKQCESHYGAVLPWKRHEKHQCAVLKCSFWDGGGHVVVGNGVVVLDGTKCGPGKACFKGKCIEMSFLGIRHGVWSEWSDYSQCSRSCEGLQFRSRHCIQRGNFSLPCRPGKSRIYRTCGPKCGPADRFNRTFWDQKCQERYPSSRPIVRLCDVYCLTGAVGRKVGYLVDGTRYSLNHANYDNTVCLHGTIKGVGCDQEVHSTKLFDRCSVCGGNGTTCKAIKGVYTDNPAASGNSNGALIAELLPGTVKAVFEFRQHTRHCLGVTDINGKYLVGCTLGLNLIQTIQAAGTQIRYMPGRKRRLFKNSIVISSQNLTNAVLRIMYIKHPKGGPNPGVQYEYYAPDPAASSGRPEDFEWKLGTDWIHDHITCPDTKARRRYCLRKDDGTPASDAACPKPMPAVCEPKWRTFEWSRCSKTCGNGTRGRIIKCIEKVSEGKFREVNSCPAAAKPNNVSFCNEFSCLPQWKIGEWSECSATCGIGMKRRNVSCYRINEAGIEYVIDDAFCRYLGQPASAVQCNASIPCPITACTSNPCLNGATCADNGEKDSYNCTCAEGFRGDSCQDPIPACTSNPCLNGATCVDNGAIDNYTCTCAEGFRGDRCQVSNFYEIGCFIYKTAKIPLLGDLTKQFDDQKTEPTVVKCAELAQGKGYKFFVLMKGKCYSGPNASEQYFTQGSGSTLRCPSGVGAKGFVFAYTFDPVPVSDKLGCYVAVKKRKKSFRIKYMDARNQFDGNDTKSTIERCLRVAIARKIMYFAVRNNGECMTDPKPARYKQLGKAKAGACKNGVGLKRKGSMMVYRRRE